MNFQETSSENLVPRTLWHQTQDDQESVLQLFKLEDDTAISINLLLGAGPPDHDAAEVARMAHGFPPRSQSLDTEQFVFLNKQKEAYFFGKPGAQPKEVIMEPLVYREPYGREAGEMVDTTIFPVKAKLYCEGRRVMLALIGEPNKEYHWQINIQGALYKGTYA